jgi:hypothetical protein
MNDNANNYIDITTKLFKLYNTNQEGLTELFDNINQLINNFNKQPEITQDNTEEEIKEEIPVKPKKERKTSKNKEPKEKKPKKEKKIKN